jgi:hypothetical protein
LVAEQLNDPLLKKDISNKRCSHHVKDFGEKIRIINCSNDKIAVPKITRSCSSMVNHTKCHLRVNRTEETIAKHWPKMRDQITNYSPNCQRTKKEKIMDGDSFILREIKITLGTGYVLT